MMPANRDFSMHITVGDVELPEYEENGLYYVECPLDTPYTYKLCTVEIRDGETEKQEVPVTPYQIKICAGGTPIPCYYRVFVDGQVGNGLGCRPFQTRYSKGHLQNGVFFEYLFSLARLTCEKTDRLRPDQARWIGTIIVECWEAKCIRKDNPAALLDYLQASKKDNNLVTKGKYTMTTTRVGKKLPVGKLTKVDYCDLKRLRSRLAVHYRMAKDLGFMGFRYQRIPFNDTNDDLMSSENRTAEAPTESISDANSSDSQDMTDSQVHVNTNTRRTNKRLHKTRRVYNRIKRIKTEPVWDDAATANEVISPNVNTPVNIKGRKSGEASGHKAITKQVNLNSNKTKQDINGNEPKNAELGNRRHSIKWNRPSLGTRRSTEGGNVIFRSNERNKQGNRTNSSLARKSGLKRN